METISFIVVNANGQEHLSVLLKSIEALDYPKELLEILVVDNASRDGSVQWLAENYPAVKVIANAANEGFARPNNVAAKQAHGEWLALVNNDMRLEPNWVLAMLEVARAHHCDCLASRILDWSGKNLDFSGSAMAFSGHGLQPHYGQKAEGPFEATSYPIPFACGGAMLVRREAFLEVGGFDESYFAYYEDVDLGWRLWLYGYEVRFVSHAIAYHRHNATSKNAPAFQKRVLMERNALYSVLKNYSDENLAKVLPAVLLLANKRFVVRSGIDSGEFRFALPQSLAKSPISWKKPLEVLFKQGPKALLKKVMLRAIHVLSKRLGTNPPEGQLLVERDVLAQAVAYSEVADRIEEVMARRQEIQAHRRRPDQEILTLFGDPFVFLEGAPDYQVAHRTALRAWGIEQIFS